jgi:hypothetical protein
MSDGHPVLPPSGEGTVVLDIGGSVGALVVHTPPAFAGHEIEIARPGDAVAFVHTEVRERVLPEGRVYAAVFVLVPEGSFILLDGPPGAVRDVVIQAGKVTEVHW